MLAGQPNAGKSSLFNALAGKDAALVSPQPGTTRDYLVQRLQWDGIELELIDTAGEAPVQPTSHGREGQIVSQAQAARQQQVKQADLVLLCLDATQPIAEADRELLQRSSLVVTWTKADLLADPLSRSARESDWHSSKHPVTRTPVFTSAVRGDGINLVRSMLASRAREARRPSALAPSLTRCRHHVDGCLDHIEQALAIVSHAEPMELLALELRLALDQLGQMVGTVYTEDLLDRIFSQFCIGK